MTSHFGTHVLANELAQGAVDDDAAARLREAASLAGQINRAAVQKLLGYLGDEHPVVRWQAGVALANTAAKLRRRARLGSPTWSRQAPELTFSGLLLLLRQSLRDPDPRRRAATADAFALWDHEVVVAFLIQAMEDSDSLVRASAAASLARIRDRSAVDVLVKALVDPSLWVRRAAADALGAIAEVQAASALQALLADPQPLVRASAVCALGHLPTSKARNALEQCAQNGDVVLAWYAARGLAQIGDMGSLSALQHLQSDHTVLFGRATAEVAADAMETIKRRERGLWNWLRRTFFNLRLALAKKH